MKRITLPTLFIVLALMLSSCSLHLGLSKMLGGGGSAKPAATKHVKATHTPPSPSSQNSTGAQTPAAASGESVTITSGGYQPNLLTVKAGTTVTWTNNDSAAESVTSDTAGLFDSGSLAAGATFKFTFSQAGTFTYHSTTNPALKGTVVVTP
jgi:plastocyanin